MNKNLNRFLEAQEEDYELALSEIKSGRKINHWMWYIFPQFKGLGFSQTSKFYEIIDLNEAKEFLNHPILGSRLREISTALLQLKGHDANKIFGSPDDLKLKSCMTLFNFIDEKENRVFKKVLDKFFNGQLDNKTINLIKETN